MIDFYSTIPPCQIPIRKKYLAEKGKKYYNVTVIREMEIFI